MFDHGFQIEVNGPLRARADCTVAFYMCETAFSALTKMKRKDRSRLTVDTVFRVCLSEI